MSNSLHPCELQHTRLPYSSLSLGVCSNSCPLNRWCHPTIPSSVASFSSCPQSFPTSGSFPDSALHISWPKYWSVCFNISPCNEYSGLISFRIDWFDLFAVQGTLKSLFQFQFEASVLWCSIFFMVQLSHPYMTTGKTIALTIWTFVGKMMSLLFNTLTRFVILCFQGANNFMAVVTICSDFGAQGNKICHCFHFFPTYLPTLRPDNSNHLSHPDLQYWFRNSEIFSALLRIPPSLTQGEESAFRHKIGQS